MLLSCAMTPNWVISTAGTNNLMGLCCLEVSAENHAREVELGAMWM
jgi:hypothetical protein